MPFRIPCLFGSSTLVVASTRPVVKPLKLDGEAHVKVPNCEAGPVDARLLSWKKSEKADLAQVSGVAWRKLTFEEAEATLRRSGSTVRCDRRCILTVASR